MEHFAEKPTYNLSGLYFNFVSSQRRTEACLGVSHTIQCSIRQGQETAEIAHRSSMQFFTLSALLLRGKKMAVETTCILQITFAKCLNFYLTTFLCLFRQAIRIPMGTHCTPLLVDLFLYSYEDEFLSNMIRSGHRRLTRSFNLCYRYKDDLIAFYKTFFDYLKVICPS